MRNFAVESIVKEHWAIRARIDAASGEVQAPELDRILAIAQRIHEPDMEAVAQAQIKLFEAQSTASLMRSSGVAQINIIGSLFRYANIFTRISGGASVEGIQSELDEAIDDPSVKSILLNIDSPGGQVSGISDLAQSIRNSAKPVVAFIDDLGASAAYWLASAAHQVVASDTSALGSIGVVATVVQDKREIPGVKRFEFVSSISPKKRADLDTDEGKSQIQAVVDDLAAIFLGKVATYRNTSTDKVLSDFGQGGILIGGDAVSAGMADEVGTRESVMAQLLKQAQPRSYSFGANTAAKNPERNKLMDNPVAADPKPAEEKIDTAKIAADARAAERTRIAGILNAADAEGRDALARTLALETDLTPEAALKVLAAAPKAAVAEPVKTADSDFQRQMNKVANPTVGVDTEPKTEQDEINAEVDRILKAGN
jgi:ClpP class serine protease